ncbi:MAG: hypothetical protein REI09_00005, partial [Candidatus Dactylopiibacterium sp.]|nr:hypothetical protein [Candidatus Dactylopiibacterium sp.]
MNHNTQNDYWPGFVDALVNMLLNLLFVSGIMAVAVAVLGMQIASDPNEAARLLSRVAGMSRAAAQGGPEAGEGREATPLRPDAAEQT